MSSNIEQRAALFAREYSALFHGPVNEDQAVEIASAVSKRYRPGVTFFTNGRITAFETQEQAADLIESEIRTVVKSGLGLDLRLNDVKAERYTERSALCRLTFTYNPAADEGRFANLKPWTFTNVYGYREDGDIPAGWEFVLRDEESSAMEKATGSGFEK